MADETRSTDPWDGRRRALLDAYFDTFERIGELERDGRGAVANRLRPNLTEIHEAYVAGLPRRTLSRDPHTDAVVEYLIDDVDLDGLFWNYEAPSRPATQPVPLTFFALTGAVRLEGDVTPAPFLCKPGPEVPYVIPRILDHEAMLAVVSTVAIGAHRGFAIFYFAQPLPSDLERANTWGTANYRFASPEGRMAWNSVNEDFDELDYDLAPWLESGKLRWIAPGDEGLVLRATVDDCPYLDLDGRREFTRIQDGKVWWLSDM